MRMYEKMRTRPAVPPAERAVGEKNDDILIQLNSNMRRGNSQGVCSCLLEGKNNAQTASELASVLGITPRQVTRQIEYERLMGEPICAGQNGYYFPANIDDLRHYAHAFDRRLRHIKATRAALEDMLVAVTGQTELEGVD